MQLNLIPAVKLICQFEGLRLKAYKDPVGIWTIGYGTTVGVHDGMEITKEKAELLMYEDIKNIRLPAIQELVKVPISNNQLCALISFCYNVGLGNFQISTMLRKLNAGMPKERVAPEFEKWTKANGKILPGLVSRRKAEMNLFLKPDEIEVHSV